MQGPGIIITIELDPFYQDFLRTHFGRRKVDPFFWPKNHNISKKFMSLLQVNPKEFKPISFGDNSFSVDIPFLSHINKDPFIHNYLSKNGNYLLTKSIKDFFDLIFHEFLTSKHKDGFNHKEAILIFMDEYSIDENNYDRLIKNAQRWRNRVKMRNYRKSTKNKLHFN